MSHRIFLFVLLLLAGIGSLRAQTAVGPLSGRVFEQPDASDIAQRRQGMAGDVMRLEVYDEATDDEIRQNRRFAEKQKVMNIRTKRDFRSMFDGFFLGAWGLDMNRDEDGSLRHRYGVGLTTNLYSEKVRFSFDGYSNNIGRSSNRLRDVLRNRVSAGSYVEQHHASLFFSRLWGKNRREGQSLGLSYAYDNNYTHSGSATLCNYFATNNSPARIYADTTSSHSSGGTHTVKVYGLIHPGGRHQFSSRNEFSYSSPSSGSAQQIVNRSETLNQRTEVLEQHTSHSYTLKNNLNYQNYELKADAAERVQRPNLFGLCRATRRKSLRARLIKN